MNKAYWFHGLKSNISESWIGNTLLNKLLTILYTNEFQGSRLQNDINKNIWGFRMRISSSHNFYKLQEVPVLYQDSFYICRDFSKNGLHVIQETLT
jgi:hypothetical protein